MRNLCLFAALLCAAITIPAVAPTAAYAYTAPTAEAAGATAPPTIEAHLTSPQAAVGNAELVPLALQIVMPQGWHTYWRSPGAAGLPPSVVWETQTNVKEITTSWPRPIRFSQSGLETFGYKDQVTLPLTAVLAEPGKPVVLKGRVDTIICTEICVPASADIAFELPAGEATPSSTADIWLAAVSELPLTATAADAELQHLQRHDTTLKAALLHNTGTTITDIIIETPAYSEFKDVATTPIAGGTEVSATFESPSEAEKSAGQDVTLTFLATVDGAPKAIELKSTIGYTMQSPGAAAERDVHLSIVDGQPGAPGLWIIILFAILGGLILNLMPCVLPVLSLKLLSVINHAGETKARIRRGFLATTAGILVSFWVLAAATIALKETGMALGWGIQFQQPLFLAFLVAVVTFFTANMWGFFEIGLPRLLRNKFAGPTPGDASVTTEFLTGVFATLLATPCTAPFVGTAVGFALSQGALQIAIIFTALGVGLALPYLLVALFPAIAHHLPKPGAWMNWLKIILGIALLLTAAWLIWVLWMQTSTLVAGIMLLLMVLLLWALRKQQMITAILLGLLLVLSPISLPHTVPVSVQTPDTAILPWTAFTPDEIPGVVAGGKVVFVDLTASWCITCHANKTLVLETNPVVTALKDPDVVLMQGDWTRPSPIISDYLQKYGRYGIPFNIVFGPGATEGILLPELLTPTVVIDAITKAKGQ